VTLLATSLVVKDELRYIDMRASFVARTVGTHTHTLAW